MTTSQRLGAAVPFFITDDLEKAVGYYVDRLGFTFEFDGPAQDPYYAQVKRDRAAVMLKAISPSVHPAPNRTRHEWARWDAYIYTENPDSLFSELVRRGAQITKPLSFIDDGLWGFEVSDADGYILAFFCNRDGRAQCGDDSSGA